MSPGRQLGFFWGGAAAALLAGWVVLGPAAGDVVGSAGAALPACGFKAVTGLPCAGCGTTRAIVALSRLDLGAALGWNPLATASVLFAFFGGLAAGLLALLGRGVREPARWPGWARLLAAGAIAANWVFLVAAGR